MGSTGSSGGAGSRWCGPAIPQHSRSLGAPSSTAKHPRPLVFVNVEQETVTVQCYVGLLVERATTATAELQLVVAASLRLGVDVEVASESAIFLHEGRAIAPQVIVDDELCGDVFRSSFPRAHERVGCTADQ